MEWASHRAGLVPTRCSQGKQCLLSSKKIGSGAFSKVYLAYATQERMRHNSKLASDLVLELAAHGDLLEHINATSAHRRCPGLEEEEARRLLWQLVSAVAHCHNSGIVHR